MKNQNEVLKEELFAVAKNLGILGAIGLASSRLVKASKETIKSFNKNERVKAAMAAQARRRGVINKFAQAKKLRQEKDIKMPFKVRMAWALEYLGIKTPRVPKIPSIEDVIYWVLRNGLEVLATIGRVILLGLLAIAIGALGNSSKSKIKESLESLAMAKNISKDMLEDFIEDEDEDEY